MPTIDTTATQTWTEPTVEQTRALPTHQVGHVELSNLGRYALIGLLAGGCALLSAWSGIDLRETSVALDKANSQVDAAKAERLRLELELASLMDPAWLSKASEGLQLDSTVRVVSVGGGSPTP